MSAQDLSEYKDLFIQSAKDHLKALEQQISLINPSENSKEILEEIYRRAHSLKGSSAIMGHSSITQLCSGIIDLTHSEDAFSTMDQHTINQLKAKINTLRELLEKI